MSRWLTEEEQRAWRGLVRMASQLNARGNRQLQDEYGISLADYEVLVVLSEAPEGRLRVFEVADALAWEQSRVSHQLARMQRRGLVAREDCATDARGAFAVLTAAGRAAIERAAPAPAELVRHLAFDRLSHDEGAAERGDHEPGVDDRAVELLEGGDERAVVGLAQARHDRVGVEREGAGHQAHGEGGAHHGGNTQQCHAC